MPDHFGMRIPRRAALLAPPHRRGSAHRIGRRSRLGQAVVEFAIMLPVLVVLGFSGITINTFIQARGQLSQGVSRAALTAAREAEDPCLPGDPAYLAVVAAFQGALTSTAFTRDPSGTVVDVNGKPLVPTIQCATQDLTLTVSTGPDGVSTGTAGIPAWLTAREPLFPLCYQVPVPQDRGCFSIWRGGIVAVSATIPVNLKWIPFFNRATVADSAGEQLEPFRAHFCGTALAPVPASFPSAYIDTAAC